MIKRKKPPANNRQGLLIDPGKQPELHAKKHAAKSPSHLSQVNGDCCTGSSPGLGSSLLQTFPRRSSQWHIMDSLPITVAGPHRLLTGFSIMSLRTPVPGNIYFLFSCLFSKFYHKWITLSKVFILLNSTNFLWKL